MKIPKKRIFALFLCLVAVLSVLPGSVWAADTIAVYCQPPVDWEDCFVYWWGSEHRQNWPGVSMSRNEGGLCYYEVPTNIQSLLFHNGKGQQTADLQLPDSSDVYLVEQKTWLYNSGVRYTVAGVGSLCGSSWDPADRNNRMSDPDGDGIFTKTYENVAAGTYELKVTVGSWSQSWGDPEKGSNYILTVEQNGTDVTVGFDTAQEKIVIYLNGALPEPPAPTYTLRGNIGGTYQALLTGPNGALSTQGSGAYSFSNLLPGAYELCISMDGYVTRTYAVTVVDADVTQDAVLNLQGDVTGEGKVNIGDIARIYSHIRGSSLLFDYALVCADYSGDGTVNIGDTARLYSFIRNQVPPVTPKPPVEPEPPAPPVSGVYVVGEDTLPYSDEQIYQQLFDPNSKLQINLDMSDAELQKLQEDYERYRNMGSKSPIYRLGNMTITITTDHGTVSYLIKEVGARMKGNTSRTSFYNKDEGIYKYIHFKFDFQETFDDEEYYGSDCKVWESDEARNERKDRTFATLEKLEMRWNKLYDSTYLKESYAYDVFRSEGVLAPQCNIGALIWSGAAMGIYTVQEPVDKLFIERNVPEADQGGDLYKLGWTSEGATFTNTNSIGAEDEDKAKFYIYDIKTNKKKTDHSTLINMINTLNNGRVTKDSFAGVVDVDNFLRFAAVSYFMGNGDDLRNNYNNCYVYFLKSSGKAVFIPYDFDRCLGVNREWNPNGNSMTKDDPFGNGNQKSPLFRYSVDKGGFYTQEYTQILLEVAENELLKAESFEARFNIAKNLYQNQVKPERNLKNAEGRDFSFDLNRTGSASGGDNMSFRDYMNAKMSSFRSYMGITDTQPGSWDCYIRGDFTSWNLESNYAMQKEGDRLTYTLRLKSSGKLKIYDNQNGTWMGAECISADTTVSYETDGHTNIILPSGNWKILYTPETKSITITGA